VTRYGADAPYMDELKGNRVKLNRQTSPITAQTPDYVGRWAEMGEMHFAFELCADGHNMDELNAIFVDKACPVEHWGYVIDGHVRVEYTDGSEETLETGDAYYVHPGHRPYTVGATELLQLTRRSAHNELVASFVKAGLFPSE
jgi:hypothetical protein